MTPDAPKHPFDLDDLQPRGPSSPAGVRPAAGGPAHDPFGPQGDPFAPKSTPTAAPLSPSKDPFFEQMDALAAAPVPEFSPPNPFGSVSSLPDPLDLPPQHGSAFGAASYAPPHGDTMFAPLPPASSSSHDPLPPAGPSFRDHLPPVGSSFRDPLPPAGSSFQDHLPPAGPSFHDHLPPAGPSFRDPLPAAGSSFREPPSQSPHGMPHIGEDIFGSGPLPSYSTAPGTDFLGPPLSAGRPRQQASSDLDFATPPPTTDAPDLSPLGSTKLKHSRDEQIEKAFEIAALNPLVAAAAPLLWLAARLHESMPPDDMRIFRDRVLEEVRSFETAAMARGMAPRSVRIARYLLCANIDDIVLNTNWGGQSNWAGVGLVSTLYSETIGGERFYDLLSQLYTAPDDNIELLELIALCLSIGFVGKYRVAPGGLSQLNRLRSELYRTIRQIRGPYDRTLAPPWEIIAAPHRPPPRMLPLWLIIGVAVAILLGVYATFSIIVGNHLQAANERLSALVPALPVLVEKPPIPNIPEPRRPPPPPPPPPPPVHLTQVERISAQLKPEIADHRVEVVGSPDNVAVRLLNAPFPSARAALAKTEAPLIKRIAQALDKEPGTIRVIGYTDNVGSNASNDELSKARAESVMKMLQQDLTNPGRVSAEGRGAADPIASNATADGRAQNRRVEFQLPAEKAR